MSASKQLRNKTMVLLMRRKPETHFLMFQLFFSDFAHEKNSMLQW
jgi:hypothetical protein